MTKQLEHDFAIGNMPAENVANRIWQRSYVQRICWKNQTALPSHLIAKFIRLVDNPLPPIVSYEISEFVMLADFFCQTQIEPEQDQCR